METGERLAAYLAGELDADESRALEAELAREPRLRARLDAIRSSDAALADLPEVEVPRDFSTRLRAAVDAELREQLGDGGDPHRSATVRDLAARRARRAGGSHGRWPQVAAAAAVLAIAGIGIAQLGGGGADSGAPTMASDDADIESATTMTAPPPEAGPTVIAAGRTFDAESLRELAADARFDEIVDQGLVDLEAREAADEHERAIAGDGEAETAMEPPAAAAPTEAGDADDAGEDAAGAAGTLGLRQVGDVTPEDLEDVRRCLPELLQAQTAVIPVYAELATFEDQEAIVYGLVGRDPEQGTYSRVELWVVGRGDCQPIHFAQVDR